MSHDNKKDFGNNESIFNDSSAFNQGFSNPIPNFAPEQPTESGKVAKFFENIANKITGKTQLTPEDIEFQKQLEKFAKENEDILEVFNKFGCKIEYIEGNIKIHCPQLNLVGLMTIQKDNTAELDDNTKKIMAHLATLVSNTNSLTAIVNEYEKQGFYPVGDLIKKTILYEGNSIEVLSGNLQNNKGETKTIYYYKGKEITPDE